MVQAYGSVLKHEVAGSRPGRKSYSFLGSFMTDLGRLQRVALGHHHPQFRLLLL